MFNLHRVQVVTTVLRLLVAAALISPPLVAASSPSSSADKCTNTTIAIKLRNCTFESSIQSWGNLVEVGTPPQRLCLVPSTVINSTLVSQESLCEVSGTLEPHKCEALRGGFFNENVSSTWTGASLSKYNDSRANPTWEHFNPPGFTKVGWDKLVFPNTGAEGVTLFGAGIALNQYGNNSNAGMLGLGIDSVFLNDAVHQGVSGSRSWSLDAGSNSLVKPREGELVIGGYNLARTDGSFSWSKISSMSGDRPCPLRTKITGMEVTKADGTIVPIMSSAEVVEACIEVYDNLFRFTSGMLFNWKSVTGFNETLMEVYSGGEGSGDRNLSFTELGLPYDSEGVKRDGIDGLSLSIQLDNGYKSTLPWFELQRPLLGFDNLGNKVAVEGVTNLQVLNVPTGEGEVPVLGKIFLSRSYLAVNYETSEFGLTLAAIDPSTPDKYVSFPSKSCSSNGSSSNPNDPGSTSDASSEEKKTPLGAIIGGSVGGFIFLLLLAIAAIYVVRKRRRERRRRETSELHSGHGWGHHHQTGGGGGVDPWMVAQGLGGHQHVNAGQISEVYSDPQLEYAHNLGLGYSPHGTPRTVTGTGTVWEAGSEEKSTGQKGSDIVVGAGTDEGVRRMRTRNDGSMSGQGSFVTGERDRDSPRTPRTAYSDIATPGSIQGGNWPHTAGRPLYEVPG